jgi:hypothetical protein
MAVKQDGNSVRRQFSTRAVLTVMAALACVLAIWNALPLGARQFGVSFLIVASLVCSLLFVLVKLDRLFVGKPSPASSDMRSVVLAAISFATISIVFIVALVQLPARSGSVQSYVDNPSASFVFRFRGAVSLSLLAAPILCGILSLFSKCKAKTFFHGWTLVGIVSYLTAWILIVCSGFIPMV